MPATEGPRRHRLRRALLWILAIVVVFHVVGGWYFSGVLHDRALSGEARRASNDLDPDLVVQALAGATIVLRPDGDDPPSALEDPGVYGLRWEGGNGTLGEVLKVEGDDVARSFQLLDGEPPSAGTRAELDVRLYTDPAQAGVNVEEVTVDGPLGGYPAWYVPAGGDTWVIVVHGNSLSRLDGIRWLPTFRDAGYPSLTITYRNDAGAPEDPSGLLRYGRTEWADLEAAVRYALDQGAGGVVLFGISMGGGVSAAFMARSELDDQVRALVLDAPMLDFDRTVDDNASREPLVGPLHVPPTLTTAAQAIADLRYDVGWSELRYLEEPQALGIVPVLIVHGTDDLTVPIATSRDAAERYPGTVTLHECEGADHLACWNRDPAAVTALVTEFLDAQAPASQG